MTDCQARRQQHAQHARVYRMSNISIRPGCRQLVSFNQTRRQAPFFAEGFQGACTSTKPIQHAAQTANTLARNADWFTGGNNWRKRLTLNSPNNSVRHALQSNTEQ